MDKLQFLDLSDLNPAEEEELINILYNVDVVPPAVDMLPNQWTQRPISYKAEPLNGGGEAIATQGEAPVDYGLPSPHMMVPHTLQYTQMTPPSVYVNSMTANVNLQNFVAAQPYAQVPFIPVDSTQRKPKSAKSPSKASAEVQANTNYPSPYPPQTFAPAIYPPQGYLQLIPPPIPRPFPIPRMFSPTVPLYGGMAPVFQPMHPAAVQQQPPAEPREESEVYQVQASEEEQQPPHENEAAEVVIEEQSIQEEQDTVTEEVATDVVVETPMEVEKPPAAKVPPVSAIKSAVNSTQKSSFPMPSFQHKHHNNGPQFVEPPVDVGPPRKSYAQMAQASDSAATKPLAMIPPTVFATSNNHQNKMAQTQQQPVDKPSNGLPPSSPWRTPPPPAPTYTNNVMREKVDKIVVAPGECDINLQRLGEFLTNYQLDHRPMPLQPRGLTNRSNYCYINAILQALVACPPFYNLMKSIPSSQTNKNGQSHTPIIDSMVKFVNEFELTKVRMGRREKAQASKDGIAPGTSELVPGTTFEPTYVYKMLNVMHAAFPIEGRQEDAEEFLSCLLNGLNDEMLDVIKLSEPQTNGFTNGDVTVNENLSNNGDYDAEPDREWTEVVSSESSKYVVTRRAEFRRTPLSAIFRGQIRSRVFRTGVETVVTSNIQPFFALQLDIEKANSVVNALELLTKQEDVVGGGVCPKTHQEVTMKTQTSLEELPLVLLLHLKCFHYKQHTCSKIIKTVDFPIDLKIDNKLFTGKSKGSRDRQYKLLAVVYHDGKEATKGHYLTDVYNPHHSCWVRFDDATVRVVSQQQVLTPKPPRVPYLLYYRRCDTINPPTMPQDRNR